MGKGLHEGRPRVDGFGAHVQVFLPRRRRVVLPAKPQRIDTTCPRAARRRQLASVDGDDTLASQAPGSCVVGRCGTANEATQSEAGAPGSGNGMAEAVPGRQRKYAGIRDVLAALWDAFKLRSGFPSGALSAVVRRGKLTGQSRKRATGRLVPANPRCGKACRVDPRPATFPIANRRQEWLIPT